MLNLQSHEVKAELVRIQTKQTDIANRLGYNRRMVSYVLRTWGINRERDCQADRIQRYIIKILTRSYKKAA